MSVLYCILFLLACILFALSAWNKVASPRNLQAAGLFCFALVFLIQQFMKIT